MMLQSDSHKKNSSSEELMDLFQDSCDNLHGFVTDKIASREKVINANLMHNSQYFCLLNNWLRADT